MPGYHNWEKHVRHVHVLLYSTTAGAVERGEAKI